jgi:hypothetical protein
MRSTASPKSLPVKSPHDEGAGVRPLPTAFACLRCQLTGRRNMLCSRADACKELPLVLPIGPVLLALWLATAIAFVVAIWTR